jgi:probable HAF family extracellular repeat protein
MGGPLVACCRRLVPSLISALTLAFSACAPDAPVAPTSPELASPSAARVSGVTTTTIVPGFHGYPPQGTDWAIGRATAINEAGVVAGWKVTATNDAYAFIWKDGVMTSLGTSFTPVAINRSGDVVGGGVVWRDGTLTPLAPANGGYLTVSAMNDKGQIVGTGRPSAGAPIQAVLWENGTLTGLGTLGGTSSSATSIDNHGRVVGYSLLSGDAVTHAFLWERGVMADLGTLFGGSSFAYGINDRGEVVGLTDRTVVGGPPLGTPVPFIWRKGVMTPMLTGAVSEMERFVISDISDAGHVVGARACGTCDMRAFVWRDGEFLYLPGRPTFALSVNSSGEIVGYENPPIGGAAAFLWTVGRHGP